MTDVLVISLKTRIDICHVSFQLLSLESIYQFRLTTDSNILSENRLGKCKETEKIVEHEMANTNISWRWATGWAKIGKNAAASKIRSSPILVSKESTQVNRQTIHVRLSGDLKAFF
jgi:hypothetical protein